MDSIDGVYAHVQGLFQAGLVMIVGSGASCAYGLPSMGDLARALISEIPEACEDAGAGALDQWSPIAEELADLVDLESALDRHPPTDETLVTAIQDVIARTVAVRESEATLEILSATQDSAFGRVLAHASKTSAVLDVVTTNYDRLVEVHAARVSLPVDTMFAGTTVGVFDPALAADQMRRPASGTGRRAAIRTTVPHIRLAKPHGSLDWHTHYGRHYRSDMSIPGSRKIIAPGAEKYRAGYEEPFDAQRARATAAIDRASALLFVGYGFNDAHLETHLQPERRHVPTAVLAHTLTANARSYLELNHSAIGVERASDETSRVVWFEGELEITGDFWDLNHVATEVLSI